MISFCLVSSDHGPLILNRLDYNDGADGVYGVGAQILANRNYDPDEVMSLLQVLYDSRGKHGDGVVAIDCGANIGVHSLEWSRHMRGWGSVIAIEAQERVFYALAGNLALQNCSNARAIWAAVDKTCGEMMVAEPDYWQPSSFGSLELRPKASGAEYIGQCIDYEEPTLKVRTLSIDSLKLPRVDLIKMDIEGMEIDALEGAARTIERCRPVLALEYAKCDRAKLDMTLRDMSYEVVSQANGNLIARGKDQ